MMNWLPLFFQNISSTGSLWVDWFHDYVLILVFFVVVFVGGLLIIISTSTSPSLNNQEEPFIEFFWTLAPVLVLVLVGVPSLSILYSEENNLSVEFALNVEGHQWFWSYDYGSLGVSFDSYLNPSSELIEGSPRLLETDNHVVFPLETVFQVNVGSSDVLHSWALPALGLNGDANPGRLNLLFFPPLSNPGLFYGQCSEICGANHSFIPICAETTPLSLFFLWAEEINISHFSLSEF